MVKTTRVSSVLSILQTVAAAFWLIPAWTGAAPPVIADPQSAAPLGPDDLVSVQIYGQSDKTDTYVGKDGNISAPLVGPVHVAGMTPAEAAKAVAKALKDGGYFTDPQVTILLTQSNSQMVSVLGEVTNSGRYPINPRTTVLDLLAQAGGLRDSASDIVFILRPDADGHANRIPVNLGGLGNAGSEVLTTAKLQGGDSLLVPRAESVFVYGEVTTPGKYRLGPGMTVAQAIASAGGVNARGSERRIQLKRIGKDGKYVVTHPKPGDQVQPNDIIQIKESFF